MSTITVKDGTTISFPSRRTRSSRYIGRYGTKRLVKAVLIAVA